MAQPLHVPPKPAESAKLRTRLYELTMGRPFKQFFAILVVGMSQSDVFELFFSEFRYISSALE